MLVRQALCSIEIWTGEKCTNEKTEEIINSLYKKSLNVSLVGMPSSGKSTIGKILAQKLNKEFVDVDEYILNNYNKSPAEIIENNGEDEFREIESNAIVEISKKTNLIIATGGGAILKRQNVENLKSNGKIIYIKRDLDKLETNNRPLSKKVGVEKLFEKRKSLYENSADFIVDNNFKIENAIERIIKYYEDISY